MVFSPILCHIRPVFLQINLQIHASMPRATLSPINHSLLRWEYIRKGLKEHKCAPSELASGYTRRGQIECNGPENMVKDERRFYWEIACPYDVYWLGSFNHPKHNQCYVLNPCWLQIRAVKCKNMMLIKTLESISRVEPILCVIRDDYEDPPSFPHCQWGSRFDTHIELRMPQCCECWSCWDMKVTMPGWKAPGER
ncbi:hypothetical protein DPMN_012124 [Dreissena polymorpha]|uniref:Uncharacterized protein n=1 Tax=Dreissena polymorpha TaxID=45954 RepID=A0A9D4N6D9_DREPO|nr:hypothetical protein DPMN_012124 [Dreissena polymorpha]